MGRQTCRSDREIVVYCVYGFQVSQDAAAELRRRGVRARALAGGIAAWRAMGGTDRAEVLNLHLQQGATS